MGLINPITAYTAAGALAIGLATGWTVRDWRCDAAYAKALEKAEQQRQQMQGTIDEVSSQYQAERDKADVWETEIIAKYGDCAYRHHMTVRAWEEAVKKSKK